MAPGGSSAEALTEIEKELSKLPVAELPEPELLTLAEGIRDRLYRPVIQAQDRAGRDAISRGQCRGRHSLTASCGPVLLCRPSGQEAREAEAQRRAEARARQEQARLDAECVAEQAERERRSHRRADPTGE
jgi:hypothetical protein